MPNIKSAKKRVLVSKARQERNKAGKSELKSVLKRARANTTSDTVKTASVKLDKAAAKGFIHKNKAARLKSRLVKKLTVVS
ncbi:30S ribosomal protein S20 [Clostridia bacterium]|nr:30S ribosomal protein S20 [Clostridia bacterium]